MTPPRSYLYVPGDRPDRLAKAGMRGADAIVADLEDAVAPAAKDAARDAVVDWLDSLDGTDAEIWVRVDSGARRDDDLAAVASHPAVAGIFLPKVERAAELADAVSRPHSPHIRWAPMIESATGLANIHEIARTESAYQLHLGEMDLAADLGLAPTADESELLFARSLTVIASRAAGLVAPAAPVSAEIDGHDAFRRTTRRLRALGFSGRDCIHPVQVAICHAEFTPTESEVAWAADVVAAAAAGPGAYRDSNGAMVDEAVLRRARVILARAAR
jgi:citrate lyase subunit beta / citryl-CoA lyase